MEETISPLTSIPTLRQLAMPKDTNALGTIFGGVILSQIDQAAAIELINITKEQL